MTTLMTERRGALSEDRQESLFGGGEARRRPTSPGRGPREAAPRTAEPLPAQVTVPDEITAADLRATQPAPPKRLTEPTLDDVVTRAWEGLVIGLPAACPVCHGEVVPSTGGTLSGRCTSCGVTID